MVAVLADDRFTLAARAWLSRQAPEDLSVSPWLAVEVRAALAAKLRRSLITREERDAALALLASLMEAAEAAPIVERHFRRAASICDREDLGLRAPDALHLAICEAGGHALCTYDDVLAAAARAIGVAVETP